ncbi:MAG: AAA family ATPase [Caldilineaceae bacterium]
MITSIHIQNYRSIVDATVKLAPFTLLIGANGTGKSNFLQLLEELSTNAPQLEKHYNHPDMPQKITILHDYGRKDSFEVLSDGSRRINQAPELKQTTIYRINPEKIGLEEILGPHPIVSSDGSGAVKVLDALKTGDREDLFITIEDTFKRYIPEVEKLSFVPGSNAKQLQVREKFIDKPILLQDLSEGTRLVLTILTIVYQENPPTLIGLEEIDRGLHPRLFQQVIELLSQISREKKIQIIATTHNPYLVDEFKGYEEAVVIVEKINGETQFTTVAEKLDGLLPEEEPLGQLWYSGILGGVPVHAP